MRANQGPMSIFRGNAANIIKVIPTSLLRLLVYDNMKRLVLYKGEFFHSGTDLYLRKTTSIFISCLISNLFVYPFEKTRVLMSLDMSAKGIKRSVWQTMGKIVKRDR